MKKSNLIFCAALCAAVAGSGCASNCQPGLSVEELSAYPSGGREVLFSTTFDSAASLPFELPPEYRIVPGEGVNGTSALMLDRRNSTKVGEYIAFPLKNIKPGVNYQLRVMVKGKIAQVPGSKQRKPVVCGVEYRVNGKPREVLYPLKPLTENYEQFTFNFMARPNGYEPHLVLYLWHDWSGEVYFDDVEICSEGQDVSAQILEPGNLTFRDGKRDFTIHIDPRTPLPAALLVKFTQNGKTFSQVLTEMDDDFNFRGSCKKLVPGKAEVSITVLDLTKKLALYTGKFKMNVLEEKVERPANAATFDEYGRLIVDGKPFMVMGIYGMFGETDLKRISEAGFNTLQLYASYSLHGGKKHADTRTNIMEGLDLIKKYNLRLLFSTAGQIPGHGDGCKEWDGVKGVEEVIYHAVKMVKDHPALLGWYISDESPRDMIPYLLNVREKISAIDPWHPVWTLTYRLEDMPLYNTTGDVMGIDIYPIEARAKKQTLDKMVAGLKAANLGGQPVWVVPQIFNWEYYHVPRNPANIPGSRGPNAQEMRAMPLLGVIMGARGFVFFSYTALFLHGEKLDPGSARRDWPMVKEMVKEMNSIGKFVMGKAGAKPVKVSGTDRVMAAILTADDGQQIVVTVALGPDPVKAVLHLPEDLDLKSRHGKCRKIGAGMYEFTADAIDSDILE